MSGPYIGTCLCTEVRYELRAEPLTFYVCHCTDCQARCGGPALPVMWVYRRDLYVVKGLPAMRTLDFGEGRQRRRVVCPRCDTQLWGEPVNRPGMAALRPGTLLNQDEFSPVAHVFTRSKRPWFLIPDDVPTYESGTGDPDALFRLWRDKNAVSERTLYK
ncbi:GFA family protein [Paraburkholderia phenoliruptrix]|nr:GFA family protein [Paraburkholderia phenoliruptrix]MBW9100665.1 GFA family protein [Paraburkholderia phenoliruptrix]